MEINPTVLAILVSVASAILGAAGVDLYIHFKNKTKKAIEKKKKEHREELKEALLPCIAEAIKPMSDKLDDIDKDVQEIKNEDLPMLKNANRDSLRNQLFAAYRHCDKIGYRTTEDTENFLHMKDSYESLGGNGVIADIHKQFMNLPLENLESVKYRSQLKKAKKQSKGE
jgi:hypothetical protein